MPSALDYIFTTEPGLVDGMEYQARIGKSDHVCIEWSLTVHKTQKTTNSKLKRDFWKGDYVTINEEIKRINWVDIFGGKSTDDNWMTFRDKLLLLVDRYVPFKAAFKKKKISSLSKNTMRHIKLKNEVWQD